MEIIGELINTSRQRIAAAVEAKDIPYLQGLAREQVNAGAKYIDVNCGTFMEKEPETLAWLVQVVQEAVDVPLSLDSPNPVALERALKVHRGRAIINSISLETERFQAVLPLVQGYDCSVIGLCMDDGGMPETAAQGVDYGSRLVEELGTAGISPERIYLDPLVRSIGTGPHYGPMFLETVAGLKQRYPQVHITCGLSNISFGLPQRRLLNRVFLAMAMAAGLDSAILDPLDDELMAQLYAGSALLGRDEFCGEYIAAYREGKLGGNP
ncbi:MAG: methyltetrahydrofolate cobalamin methyltransferase [Limnochordia bacterium]|jgi:cobalamin-dependent methionine synthase I